MELRNDADLTFTDISSEDWREYRFQNGETVRIDAPLWLNSGKNGHRILAVDGTSHYIPSGWLHLKWSAAPDAPHFVK